jgi:hypothetical protein
MQVEHVAVAKVFQFNKYEKIKHKKSLPALSGKTFFMSQMKYHLVRNLLTNLGMYNAAHFLRLVFLPEQIHDNDWSSCKSPTTWILVYAFNCW